MPNGFLQADRFREVNVRTHQPGGVRAGKFAVGDLRAALLANGGAGGVAYVYLARRQARQHQQPGVERRLLFGDDHLRIGGQRLGIHRGDENGARFAAGARRFAERAGAQRGPQAAGDQFTLDLFARQLGQLTQRVMRKFELIVAAVFQRNHHRLQYAPFAAVNRGDAAAGGAVKKTPGFSYLRTTPGLS